MDSEAAYKLAQNYVDDNIVVLASGSRECAFGFYFPTNTAQYLETGRLEDMGSGSCGVLVDRISGNVHELGSVYDVDYWLEAYERQLHRPLTVTITKVWDRQRAADALCRLQMTYVIPEEAYGETWRIPRHYSSKDYRKAFDDLPARFENQNLIFRLYEIQRIESDRDVEIILEPTKST